MPGPPSADTLHMKSVAWWSLLIVLCSLGIGCDSPGPGPVQGSIAFPVAQALHSPPAPSRLWHESELAARPESKADLLASVVITRMESSSTGSGDLAGSGTDDIPYVLKESGSIYFKLDTGGVSEATLSSTAGRMYVLKPGESIDVWLPAGEYVLRLTSAGPSEPDIATGFIRAKNSANVRSQTLTNSTPGVYITEMASFPNSIVGISTGNTVIVGAGPGAVSTQLLVGDSLPDSFYGGGDTPLRLAVRQYFANGSDPLRVVRVPSASPADLIAGFDQIGQGMQLLVLPDFSTLSEADADIVLQALLTTSQDKQLLVLLDLPSLITLPSQAESWLSGRPQFQVDRFCFFWPSVVGANGPMAVAPSLAGVFGTSDQNQGVADAPTGYANALSGVTAPGYLMTQNDQAQLNIAGINPIIRLNGKIVCWGDTTAARGTSINKRRTLSYIEGTINLGLQSFVFAANDAQTWSTVNAWISSFLQEFWVEGGLWGTTASDAFTVRCGVGTSMTPLDVLNGYMIETVTLYLNPGTFTELTFQQQMQN